MAITVGAFLMTQGGAFAHEGGKHLKEVAQMRKLHDMMPLYAIAMAKLEAALDKADLAAVEAEAGKMLATSRSAKEQTPQKPKAIENVQEHSRWF